MLRWARMRRWLPEVNPLSLQGRTAGDLMITAPKVHEAAVTTVADVRAQFESRHVHMVLLVDRGRLAGTVVRDDLQVGTSPATPALAVSRLDGRTVTADAEMSTVHAQLNAAQAGLRRLAVVDGDGTLLGLLCLKRTRDGYCDDAGVRARERERERTRARSPKLVPDNRLA
jgi:CBS-domain-containing membrane protein